jgi:histone H3/H4
MGVDISISDNVRQYIHAIAIAANALTRPGVEHELEEHAKAAAARAKRSFVTPFDVKASAPEVLGRSERIDAILANTPVP